MKKTVSFIVLASALACAFIGCSKSNATAQKPAAPKPVADAAAPGEDAGFEEFPLGDEVEVGFLNVGGVYFQAVDMLPSGMGTSAASSTMHIEADISALENNLGYGVGDFVPYLTVDYKILDQNNNNREVLSGTFMTMNASDGPHYGANISLGAGTYTVQFIIKSPEENGYYLHVDELTGVPGRFSDYNWPLVAEFPDFVFDGKKL